MIYRFAAVISALSVFAAPGAALAELDDFRGTWVNSDRSARGITRVVIEPRRRGAKIRVFGHCRPRACDWGETRAIAYAGNVSADLRREARVLSAVYDKGFAETTVIIRLADRGRLRVRSLTRFKDGSRRANYASTETLVRARRPNRPGPSADAGSKPRARGDCVSFNPKRAEVRNVGGRWKIAEDRHWIMDFGAKEREARRAIRIIRKYGLDRQCFVGRPDPSMTYFLTRGRIPSGAMRGEDCVGFNPATIEVRRVKGRWKIVDGNHWIMDFGRNEREAQKAYSVFRRYGATRQCFVARPGPSMSYLRR